MAKTYSFPWPVLGNGTDVSGSLDAVITRVDNDSIRISVSLRLDNQALVEHIDQGRAEYMVRVHCGKTYYRHSHRSRNPDIRIDIPFDQVRGVVQLESYVLIACNITNYRPTGLHEDYGSAGFDVEPGQIVALGPSGKLDIDLEFDPLVNPANSIIKLTPGGDPGVFGVNYEDDYIIVAMSKEDWSYYQGVKARAPHCIMSFFAVPVLAEAIRRMNMPDGTDLEEHLWYKRVAEVIRHRNIECQEDPLRAAQTILEAPVSRALKQLDDELSD